MIEQGLPRSDPAYLHSSINEAGPDQALRESQRDELLLVSDCCLYFSLELRG
jgi:hypothetical protein